MSYCVIIITHDSEPYTVFDELRQSYFLKHNIPHVFIKNDSNLYNMFGTFINFLKQNNDLINYDYIVRINSSTFLNIELFEQYLNTFPTTNCYAGYFGGIINNIELPKKNTDFISGTCITFSKDVIHKLTQTVQINYNKEDDLVIFDYMNNFNISRTFVPMYWCDNNIMPNDETMLNIIKNFPLVRIKNLNKYLDINIWKNILNLKN